MVILAFSDVEVLERSNAVTVDDRFADKEAVEVMCASEDVAFVNKVEVELISDVVELRFAVLLDESEEALEVC